MAITSQLYSLVSRLGQNALQESSDPSPHAHFELLQMIDQLKLAVETPTETVLRLIYQVVPPRNPYRVPDLTDHSLRKMPH